MFDLTSIDKTADPLHRLLPVHLRQLDEEQSHPCHRVPLGQLQHPRRHQQLSPLERSRRRREAPPPARSRPNTATSTPPAWMSIRPTNLAPDPSPPQLAMIDAPRQRQKARPARRPLRSPLRPGLPLRRARRPGPEGRQPANPPNRPGRPHPPRPGLLPQPGRAQHQAPRTVCRAP